MMPKYAGTEWLDQKWLKRDHWKHGKEMSPLGKEVADLLGQVWAGLYHLDNRAIERVDWSDPYYCSIVLAEYLDTWDFNRLTQLVVLSHDRMLRMEISGCGPNRIRLSFWQRTSRVGSLSHRLPTMEEHTEMIRKVHGDALPVLMAPEAPKNP